MAKSVPQTRNGLETLSERFFEALIDSWGVFFRLQTFFVSLVVEERGGNE